MISQIKKTLILVYRIVNNAIPAKTRSKEICLGVHKNHAIGKRDGF